MLKGSYGKEPFDLRLTVLRTIRNLDKILVLTLVGTLLFGGSYYVKNVLLRGTPQYHATSTYKVEYADEDWAQSGTYINAMTWDTYAHTSEFLSWVQAHLQEQGISYAPDTELLTDAQLQDKLGTMITAKLPSDLRVPTTTVTADTIEQCLAVAKAVEAVMTEEFPANATEVSAIRVVDCADTAELVVPDVRPLRAFVLSAVLSFFFVTVLFLLKETGDDSIWLPSTMRKRYGIPVLGTINSKELAENAAYLFCGKKRIAVCSIDGGVNSAEVVKQLADKHIKLAAQAKEAADAEWVPVPALHLCPEICERLREFDGILLAVGAGRHAGKPLEYALEYLEQQDCKITAAILWNADELLIKSYYCFRDDAEV